MQIHDYKHSFEYGLPGDSERTFISLDDALVHGLIQVFGHRILVAPAIGMMPTAGDDFHILHRYSGIDVESLHCEIFIDEGFVRVSNVWTTPSFIDHCVINDRRYKDFIISDLIKAHQG